MRFLKLFVFTSLFCLFTFIFCLDKASAEGPVSGNYEMQSHSFGSGGIFDSVSTNYSGALFSGQTEAGQLDSTTYSSLNGLAFLLQTAVPGAPSLSNVATNHDRLRLTLNVGSDATDTAYAVAISNDNFATDTRFVKSDNTVGSSLAITDYRTYTSFGGASGTYITGLNQNTTYTVKVKARHGNYTESGYGPTANATTSTASLTFTVSSNTITFNNLNASNGYTDDTQSTVFTTSTNAYNGYTIYGRESQALTAGDGNTITNYAGTNSTPTTWSGTGFGYTTNDTDLGGSGGINRFSSGTKYAGFGTTSVGDPIADHAGPVVSPIIASEQWNVNYKVAISATQPAGTYQNTLIYTIVPSF